MKRSPLKRRTPLKPRSEKRKRIMVERRKLVAEVLGAHPRCQVCGKEPSVHCHELLSRARGGSILVRENIIAVGWECHRLIHDNPAWAASLGLLLSRQGVG